MVYEGELKGKFVELKAATVDDAEFTLSIRQDPEMTKYLPPLNITLEQQRNWINNQRNKEGDYFFVVWSLKTGKRIGTISIYDINNGIGEGGRLALYGEVHEKVEAGILISNFEFNILKLDRVTAWVYYDNLPAKQWNKQFGAVFSEPYVHSDGLKICDVIIEPKNAEIATAKLRKILSRINT